MAGKHRKGGPVDEPRPLDDAAGHAESGYDTVVRTEAPPQPTPSVSPVPQAVVALWPAPSQPSVGQGSATEAAAVLPGISSPTARRVVRHERRQRARRTRVALAAGAAVVVVALVVGLFAVLRDGGQPPAGPPAAVGRAQTTLLLEVLDSKGHTVDAVLLAHDSRDQGTGYGALVPSSLVVDVPGSGSSTFGSTSAAQDGHASAAALADSLGVLVDGTWQLDSSGLAALVDSVGGVDVTVDRDITTTSGAGTAIVVAAGPQHLAGAAAVEYATFLAPQEAEQARLARFSSVLGGVLAKLPADSVALGHTLTGLSTHSTSTLSPSRLAGLVASLRGDTTGSRMSYDSLPVRALDTGTGAPQLLLDPTATTTLVTKNFSGSLPPQSSVGPVRVLVQNGVGTPGLSDKARTKLVAAGLTYVNGGNAGLFGYPTSVILILDGSQQSRAQGDATASALGLPASDVKITSQGQNVADVVVILGKDFKP